MNYRSISTYIQRKKMKTYYHTTTNIQANQSEYCIKNVQLIDETERGKKKVQQEKHQNELPHNHTYCNEVESNIMDLKNSALSRDLRSRLSFS